MRFRARILTEAAADLQDPRFDEALGGADELITPSMNPPQRTALAAGKRSRLCRCFASTRLTRPRQRTIANDAQRDREYQHPDSWEDPRREHNAGEARADRDGSADMAANEQDDREKNRSRDSQRRRCPGEVVTGLEAGQPRAKGAGLCVCPISTSDRVNDAQVADGHADEGGDP